MRYYRWASAHENRCTLTALRRTGSARPLGDSDDIDNRRCGNIAGFCCRALIMMIRHCKATCYEFKRAAVEKN